MPSASVISLILRIIGLLSRFLLTMVLALVLTPADLGLYGLLAAAVTVSVGLVGMEFHQFSTRELLKVAPSNRGPLIRDQLILHCSSYLLWFPLCALLFTFSLLPWDVLFWFYALLLMEHLSQEAFRLFSTLARPILANIVFFLRNGAWALVIVMLSALKPSAVSLTLIWIAWGLGVLSSIGLSIYHLRSSWHGHEQRPISPEWIGRGLKTSLWFLGAAFCFNLLQLGDRFVIEQYLPRELLGVYSLYWALVNMISVVVNTGIVNIKQPFIISAFQQGNFVSYQQLLNKMYHQGIVLSLVIAVLLSAGTPVLIYLMNKPIYAGHWTSFIFLLAVPLITQIGLKAHFQLYLQQKDQQIFYCSLFACLLQMGFNLYAVPRWGLTGASISAVLGISGLSFSKICLARQLKYPANDNDQPQPLTLPRNPVTAELD